MTWKTRLGIDNISAQVHILARMPNTFVINFSKAERWCCTLLVCILLRTKLLRLNQNLNVLTDIITRCPLIMIGKSSCIREHPGSVEKNLL